MRQSHIRWIVVLLSAITSSVGFNASPALAEMLSATRPTILAGPSPADPKVASQTACTVSPKQARFDYPLSRVSRRLAADQAIKIVAIGSSSTAGAGATSSDATYPSRLEVELTKDFPARDISVLNRGVNGEEAADMLARFDTSVIAERPDLVIWQVGTNWVLRDQPLDPKAMVLHQGLARLKAIGADVVLIDPQFAPKVIAKPDAEGMVAQIAATAAEAHVDLFRRFALMKRWHEAEHLPFDTFVSPDGLHMNDWSYSCLAKWLGTAIDEAVNRPIATAQRPVQ
jgi:acyl-CoA thioesterase I